MKSHRYVLLRLLGITVLLLVATSLLVPQPVAAQVEEPVVYHACRVPEVGAIYLIRLDGTPEECLSETHIEFSWSEAGTQGPAGEPGPAGEAGPGCPEGWGVDGAGGLLLPAGEVGGPGVTAPIC